MFSLSNLADLSNIKNVFQTLLSFILNRRMLDNHTTVDVGQDQARTILYNSHTAAQYATDDNKAYDIINKT